METSTTPARGYSGKLDAIGATASTLCAVHCAFMPLAVTTLPLLGLGFLADEATEWVLVGFSVALGVASLCFGHSRHHARWPFAVLATGIALLALGRTAEESASGTGGLAMMLLGGLTIAGSHAINRRLCLACEACRDDEFRTMGADDGPATPYRL